MNNGDVASPSHAGNGDLDDVAPQQESSKTLSHSVEGITSNNHHDNLSRPVDEQDTPSNRSGTLTPNNLNSTPNISSPVVTESRPGRVSRVPSPVVEQHELEVDSSASTGDNDSALGEPVQSSTTSLRESIFDFQEENGRTYHAYNRGKYFLPNDEAEQDRLDLQHHLFLLCLNGNLHLAPLTNDLHNVVDLGTGTGIWAVEFAEQYPSASVLGTDLSPIQPNYVPPNCRFEISDYEEPWEYSYKFDYIHGRALLSCFKEHPLYVVKQAFEALKPGCYLELQDPQMPIACIDDTIKGTALEEWNDSVIMGAGKLGRVLTNSKNYGRYMEETGFVDIVERHFYWPLNTWPRGKREKMISMWAQQNLLDGINAMSMALLTRGLGWSKEQAELLLVETRNAIKNRDIHSYIDVVVFYGRKPEEAT